MISARDQRREAHATPVGGVAGRGPRAICGPRGLFIQVKPSGPAVAAVPPPAARPSGPPPAHLLPAEAPAPPFPSGEA